MKLILNLSKITIRKNTIIVIDYLFLEIWQRLVSEVMSSLRDRTTYNVVTIPSVLSIWSGIKCPIQYDTIITNEKIES